MSELSQFLFEVEKNRKLFIGDDNFIALRHLVDGYALCLRKYGVSIDEEGYAFEKYVRDVYGDEQDEISLWTRILKHTVTEEEAFMKYFELLHLFYKV